MTCPADCPRCLAGLCHGCATCEGQGGHRVGDRLLPRRWVAIVGSREHGNLLQLERVVAALPPPGDCVVVSGACPTDDPGNIDRLAAMMARARGYRVVEIPARWREFGRRAGMLRNTEVVASVDELYALPWFGSVGTHDTLRKAQAAGLPTHHVKPRAEQCEVWTTRLTRTLADDDVLDITRATAFAAIREGQGAPAWAQRFPRRRSELPRPKEVAENMRLTRGLERRGELASILEACRRARADGRPSLGEPFAPSWSLLDATKTRLAAAEGVAGQGLVDEAERRADEAWQFYLDGWPGEIGFSREMRESFRSYAPAWGWALGKRRVVLACVCAAPAWWRRAPFDRCHRFEVARMFAACGATYRGELVPASSQIALPGTT